MTFRTCNSALLVIGLAFASLLNVHLNPQTVFWPEWCMALMLVFAFCGEMAAQQEIVLRIGLPFPLALLMLVVCAAWVGHASCGGYVVYLGLFLLAYVLGAQVEARWLAGTVAIGMLGCALLQSLAGLLQLMGVTAGGVVMGKIYMQAFGNVGQANHYADLIYLGLASLAFLFGRNWLKWWAALPLAFWLALAAAASASRGTLLYMVAFLVLGVISFRRGETQVRRAGLALVVIFVCSVLAQVLVTYGHILDALAVTTALDRAGDAGSNGQRLFNWRAACQAIAHHPWIGQGPATFYKASIDAMFTTPPAGFPKFAEHAHNLPLNMAAELGLPLTIVMMSGLAWWYLRKFFAICSVPQLWALACVSVVGLHSMVEYPLWYTYFLVPVGLCMGVADAGDPRLSPWRVARSAGVVAAVVALGVVIWTLHDWNYVRAAYDTLAAGEPRPDRGARESARYSLGGVSSYSVFAQHAESLRLQSWHPDEGGAAGIADRCDAHWNFKPGWFMMMRCSEAYAMVGREASLQRIAVALCDGFPGYRGDLNQWAKDYDSGRSGGLALKGHACLKE